MHKILTPTAAIAVMTTSLLGALAAGSAQAGSASTTFAVTATVVSTCSATAAPLPFGNYTPGNGAIKVNTTISVACTMSTPYTVALNAGTTTNDAFTQRLMANGTNTLQYNLYTTAQFGTVFGDGSGSTAKISGTGAGVGTPNTVTVYGQLPDSATNQAAVPGSYSDTITVTVAY